MRDRRRIGGNGAFGCTRTRCSEPPLQAASGPAREQGRLSRRGRTALAIAGVVLASALVAPVGGCGGNATDASSQPTSTETGLASPGTQPSVEASLPTTWTAQDGGSDSDLQLLAVSFADSLHGWAVGGAPILATSDGGATWKAQDIGFDIRSHLYQLRSVSFSDTEHGWAVGQGNDDYVVIIATSNGGLTWKDQSASHFGLLNSVDFVDSKHGWAVGNSAVSTDPTILATSNGGVTWKAQDASSAYQAELDSVAFADTKHGWAVGGDSGGMVLLSTSNGGVTWKRQNLDATGISQALHSVAFIDAEHGWAVGDGGTILATNDGGATWEVQGADAVDSATTLSSVAFVDAKHGWAVGYDGDNTDGNTAVPVVFATSDGGATWEAQDASGAPSGSKLTSVAFADPAHGWAVGWNLPDVGSSFHPPIILAASR